MCMRYYEKSYPINDIAGATTGGPLTWGIISGNRPVHTIYFKVVKRSAPTFNYYNPFTGAISLARNNDASTNGTLTLNHVSDNTVAFWWNSGNTGQVQGSSISIHYTADIEL